VQVRRGSDIEVVEMAVDESMVADWAEVVASCFLVSTD
jgi:hypothetical protein